MPWKASSVMEERLRFVARLLDGETMTEVCRDFGISRKTGYKIFDRYKEHGLEALSPLQTPDTLCQPIAGSDRDPDCPAQTPNSLSTASTPPAHERRCPVRSVTHVSGRSSPTVFSRVFGICGL